MNINVSAKRHATRIRLGTSTVGFRGAARTVSVATSGLGSSGSSWGSLLRLGAVEAAEGPRLVRLTPSDSSVACRSARCSRERDAATHSVRAFVRVTSTKTRLKSVPAMHLRNVAQTASSELHAAMAAQRSAGVTGATQHTTRTCCEQRGRRGALRAAALARRADRKGLCAHGARRKRGTSVEREESLRGGVLEVDGERRAASGLPTGQLPAPRAGPTSGCAPWRGSPQSAARREASLQRRRVRQSAAKRSLLEGAERRGAATRRLWLPWRRPPPHLGPLRPGGCFSRGESIKVGLLTLSIGLWCR